jgi:hypothetical protein
MILLFSPLIPLIIGIVWMRPDASRRGQPGWLWALLTIPFGWITVFVYAVMRAMR